MANRASGRQGWTADKPRYGRVADSSGAIWYGACWLRVTMSGSPTIADPLNDEISYGGPLVRQRRNPHDYGKDLDVGRNGMIMTDDFCALEPGAAAREGR